MPKIEEAFYYFIRKENANKVNLMVLDELGRMELISPRFREVLKKIVESPKYMYLLATIPNTNPEFIEAIKKKKDSCTIEVNSSNRDSLILSLL